MDVVAVRRFRLGVYGYGSGFSGLVPREGHGPLET